MFALWHEFYVLVDFDTVLDRRLVGLFSKREDAVAWVEHTGAVPAEFEWRQGQWELDLDDVDESGNSDWSWFSVTEEEVF